MILFIFSPSGPVSVNGITVAVDRDMCIGASVCLLANKAFSIDVEGKAVILDTIDQEEFGRIVDAAQACPVQAITIVGTDGRRILPE